MDLSHPGIKMQGPNPVGHPTQNSFINGVESLHIVGTYERGDVEEEGEVYEVVNIKTLKQVSQYQACKLKFRFRDLTSCLCSAAAPAVCIKRFRAGVDATETGNEFSQLKF